MELEDILLNMYTETMEWLTCYEKLESSSRLSEPMTNETLLRELGKCLEHLESLINLENGDFYSNALLQLRQQIKSVIVELQRKQAKIPKLLLARDVTFARASHVIPRQLASASNQEQVELSSITSSVKNTQVQPKLSGLKEVAGLHTIKKELETIFILPIHQPQLFTGSKISNCVLLFGPPGTGKTYIAHALAAEAKANLHCVSSSDILSQYVGQSEKAISSLFKHIKSSTQQTLLFLDEIDCFCRQRSERETEFTRRIKTELMCQLSTLEDCSNVFVIGATNCPWDLDTAIVRRFQKRIFIPLPSRSERFELLHLFTRNTTLHNKTHWGPLLNKTEGYSGSDLADLVRTALNKPIIELQDCKSWNLCSDGYYEPVTDDNLEDSVFCSLSELPEKTVKARNADYNDLLIAADAVKKTVSDAEIKRYEQYIQGN